MRLNQFLPINSKQKVDSIISYIIDNKVKTVCETKILAKIESISLQNYFQDLLNTIIESDPSIKLSQKKITKKNNTGQSIINIKVSNRPVSKKQHKKDIINENNPYLPARNKRASLLNKTNNDFDLSFLENKTLKNFAETFSYKSDFVIKIIKQNCSESMIDNENSIFNTLELDICKKHLCTLIDAAKQKKIKSQNDKYDKRRKIINNNHKEKLKKLEEKSYSEYVRIIYTPMGGKNR